jgi:hypothetical protein
MAKGRSLLPAAGRPPFDVVAEREALDSHGEVLAERAELVAQLRRLGPAWGEFRGVLNEPNRVLED